MTSNSNFPQFVSAGDILTDLIRTGPSDWLSRPGGAGWNVARAVVRLGLPTASAGSLGTDNFSDELWDASVAAGRNAPYHSFLSRAKSVIAPVPPEGTGERAFRFAVRLCLEAGVR